MGTGEKKLYSEKIMNFSRDVARLGEKNDCNADVSLKAFCFLIASVISMSPKNERLEILRSVFLTIKTNLNNMEELGNELDRH
jgi:uncharacterized membrane protein